MSAIYDFEVLKEGDYHRVIYKSTKMPLIAAISMIAFILFPTGFFVHKSHSYLTFFPRKPLTPSNSPSLCFTSCF